MRTFIPEVSQINLRWYSVWGEEFGAPELSAEMAKNPRVADRMALSILEDMQIDVRAKFEETELVPVEQYIADERHLITLCGLVLHGEIIRNRVSKIEFEALSKFFGLEDLKIATSLPELHEDRSEFGIEINRLPELVARSGRACVQAWKSGLSEQMALRLRLIEDEETEELDEVQGVTLEHASEIVLAVSLKLSGLPFAKAA